MKVFFDMDGTIANLYGEKNWLADLKNGLNKPYRNAKPLVNMRKLGKVLNELKAEGNEIGVISWLAKNANENYNEKVTKAKLDWLKRHIGAVEWNEIHIVEYGVNKANFGNENAILFDDEIENRKNWNGKAYDEKNILNVLEGLKR